jgi:hypothetical protein
MVRYHHISSSNRLSLVHCLYAPNSPVLPSACLPAFPYHSSKRSNSNPKTDQSINSQAETGLPPNWEVRHSNSKNLPYYFNASEKVSRWEPPSGTDTEKLKHYMATHHSASSVVPGPQTAGAPEGKIRAAHLLVKHKESRRPSSWKEVRVGSCTRLHVQQAEDSANDGSYSNGMLT